MSFPIRIAKSGFTVNLKEITENNLNPDLKYKVNENANIATAAATTATTKANETLVNANAAAISANNATTQAGIATTQANIATTKANDADVDAIAVAADRATVAADKATVAADKATVAADRASTTTNATNAGTSAANAQTLSLSNSTGYPIIEPTLFLDFANTMRMPSNVTFTRNSIATYIDSKGLLQTARINQPRIDFNPLTGECLGLLMEESRINTTGNVFGATNAIGTSSAGISPSGVNDATLVQNTVSVNSIFNFSSYGTIDNGIYTRSIFVKAVGSNSTVIFEGIGSVGGAGGFIIFNAITKVWSGDTTIPISYGNQDFPNGWIRIWVVIEKSATKIITTSKYYIGAYGATSVQHNILIWGPQFELGSFLTSYIPTTTAAVTRQPDYALISGQNFLNFFNAAQGSFFAFAATARQLSNGQVPSIVGSSVSAVPLFSNTNGTNSTFDGTTEINNTLAISANTFFGVAMSYNTNSRRITVNGNTIVSGGYDGDMFNSGTTITIGSRSSTSGHINGYIKCLYYYPVALSDSQLQALTAP